MDYIYFADAVFIRLVNSFNVSYAKRLKAVFLRCVKYGQWYGHNPGLYIQFIGHAEVETACTLCFWEHRWNDCSWDKRQVKVLY